MPYFFLLSLSTMLLLTGCLPSPKPLEHEKLLPYQGIKSACKQNPPKTLNAECTQLVNDLDEETKLLDTMQAMKEDDRQENEYISLAGNESTLSQKLEADNLFLAKQCQARMAEIIQDDDINSAALCLLYKENPITLEQYKYLKAHAPMFDNNPQYKAYQAQYAKKMIQKGLQAMNKGDKKNALHAFKAAAAAKSAEAAYLAGIIYEEKQIEKAIIWHKKALAEGVNLSKVNLARLYLRIKLPKKAKAFYASAAEDNNALAQYQLFKMETKSTSLKAREEAQQLLIRSANNNYPQAQYIYGLQLLKQKKNDEAQLWLEKAQENGITDSNQFLGKIYFEQEAYDKAYPLLLDAQDKGAPNYMLAVMYEKALGVTKNNLLAYRHYKTAHELAHGNYIADMQRVQKSITSKERQAAKYIEKKIANHKNELNKMCGHTFSDKNARVANRKIHLVGVAFKPVKEASGFIIYGDNERLYYIADAAMSSKIKAYQTVNVSAKTTGKAITVSSDRGTLQNIYQFYMPKNCSK